MSHYETLGVPSDADMGAIKRAFRKLAKKHHPDLGGKKEDMAEINRAWATLSDPQRRLTYDRGEGDAPVRPVDELAVHHLMEVINHALTQEGGDMVQLVREILRQEIAAHANAIAKDRATITKLQKKRDKVRAKGERNLFHMVIDDRIKGGEAGIAKRTENIAMCSRGLELLADHEFIEDMTYFINFSGSATATANTTGGFR